MWIRVGQALSEDCVVIIDPGYTEVAVLGDIFGPVSYTHLCLFRG